MQSYCSVCCCFFLFGMALSDINVVIFAGHPTRLTARLPIGSGHKNLDRFRLWFRYLDLSKKYSVTVLTSSTELVHTSAKVHLTSVAIRIHIRYPDHHQNLINCSSANCQPSVKISCKSVLKFMRKVANRQTNRQTSNNDYVSPLAEVDVLVSSYSVIKGNFCHL